MGTALRQPTGRRAADHGSLPADPRSAGPGTARSASTHQIEGGYHHLRCVRGDVRVPAPASVTADNVLVTARTDGRACDGRPTPKGRRIAADSCESTRSALAQRVVAMLPSDCSD